MGLLTLSTYNKTMNDTNHTDMPPSELLSLIKYCTNKISRGNKGITEKEIDELCREDMYFRKNLLLEIKDVMIAVEKLHEKLEGKSAQVT